MVNCCVPFCHSERGKIAGVTFHEFPSDMKRRAEWYRVIARDFQVNGKTVVCSIHFRDEDFKQGVKIRRLTSDATPSIFPGYPKYMQPKPKGPRCTSSYEASLERRRRNVEAMKISPKKNGKGKAVPVKVHEDRMMGFENAGSSSDPMPSKKKDQRPTFTDTAMQTNDAFMPMLEKHKRDFIKYRKKACAMRRSLCAYKARLRTTISKLKSYSKNHLHKTLQRVMQDANGNISSINRNRATFLLDQLSNFYRKAPRYTPTTMAHCKSWYLKAPKDYTSVRHQNILNLPSRATLLRASISDHENQASENTLTMSEAVGLPVEVRFQFTNEAEKYKCILSQTDQ